MELGNSNGAGIPKKSRSLDLKTLYQSSVSKDSLNKSLKRKSSFGDGDDQQKQDKKSKKVVSLNSFEKFDSVCGKGLENACNGDLSLRALKNSKVGISQKVSNGRRFHDVSLGFSGSLIHIPRRKRGFIGRNKFENRQALNPAEQSINKVGLVDQMPQSVGEESKTQDQIHKVEEKKGSDSSEETREYDSSLHLMREEKHCSLSAANNGELAFKKSPNNHKKRKGLASDVKSVEKDAKPSADTCRISEGLREDDEENLEANAARMLSSRFDPSCTGFSLNSKVLLSPSVDRLPSLSFSGRNSSVAQSKSSKPKSTSVDTEDRKLRPRKNHKEKGATRKRRHFYELLASDVDSYWLLNKRIKVFWPLDENWYYGLVDDFDKERKLHHVKYDDRDEEWVDLQGERFKILLLPDEVPGKSEQKRHRSAAKPSSKRKRNVKSSKAEEKQNSTIEDDSSMENLESEPIITWLARSSHRVKSSVLNAVKKRKTAAISSSNELANMDGSVVGDAMARDKMRACTSSLPACGLADGRNGNESTSSSTGYRKGSKVPIVYYRRRFGGTKKAMCQVSKGTIVEVSNEHDVSRNLDPDVVFWPIDVSGSSELFIPWKQSKQVWFYLNVRMVSVLSYTFTAETVWLLNTAFLLHHGTLMTIWPRVRLEMLFLDNLIGLRYLFFEGCLMEAVEFIFLVLTVFHQSDDQGKYTDMRMPLSTIGFRLSCILDFTRHIAFAFYNFCEVKSSKWACMEQKIKRYSLLIRQLTLAECPYDNIKELQNGQSLDAPVYRNSLSIEVMQNRSRKVFSPMHASREPSFIKDRPSSVSDKKQEFIPPSALSSAAAPTFFLNLHLRMIMEHISRNINSLNHDSVGGLETSSSLIVNDCFNVQDCISSRSESAPEINMRALQEDATHHGCLVYAKPEKRTGNLFKYGIGKQVSFPQKTQNDVPHDISSTPPESQETEDGTPVPKRQYPQSESENCKLLSIDRMKTNTGSDHPVNGIRIGVSQSDGSQDNGDKESRGTQLSTDMTLNMQSGIIPSSNPTAPRSTWHRSKSSSSSSGCLSHRWLDVKGDFLHANFGNGPKKPRTQVSYSLPSGGYDSRNKSHLQKGVPYKRIRRSSDRKSADVFRGPQKDLESSFCDANVLVTIGDRGWRVHGARIVLEPFDDNEWKLAIKLSGTTRYSYKAHQFLQPGSTNRFTHAMMWKGGKDWILEFPDRSQWWLFKEMHEECYNRNLRAASVRHIPIPGVRLIEENDENGTEVVFAHGSSKYFRQTENDVEMALDPSRVLYDMDSDDEQWLLKINRCSDTENGGLSNILEEVFEKVMDMFEKAAYVQQRDWLTSNEIEELMVGVGPMEVINRIYKYWQTKRQRIEMPLIRHLQPPLWQTYQQQLKDWELAMTRTNTLYSGGTQEKGAVIEKPAMFAFCLKPRGLEVPNKGSKHRSQKKISVYNTVLGDHDGLYTPGRRSSGFASGDEKFLYSAYNYEYLEESPLHQISPRVFSPRDSGMKYFSRSNNGYDGSHQHKFQRSRSKKIGSFAYAGDTYMGTPFNEQIMGKRNGTDQWNLNHSEWSGSHQNYSSGSQPPNPEELVSSDLDEFRLHDAARAAKRARTMAKLKRERAERLHYKADIVVQKAVSTLMIAEAIKASSEDSANRLK